MNIACFQHVPFEGPAAIADWAHLRGHRLVCHEMHANHTPPPLEDFDILLLMGGPMNSHEESKYPWLTAEKATIRAAIQAGKIVVGICLGAQLIADSLGAPVSSGGEVEIGWLPIARRSECPGEFALPATLRVFHWHGDSFEIPAGALPIASSAACANQGFLYRGHVLGLQCHLESTRESMEALIQACAHEIRDGTSIQNAEIMRAEPDATFQKMHGVLFQFLDVLTRGRLSGETIEVIDWGRTRYDDAFEKQKARVALRQAGACDDALIFTEHEPVFTTGLRKGADQHLIWNEATLAARGVEVFQSNRGGDITYHGPGQIVGYPVLSLQERRDLHAYLRDLENVVIRTLARFGLPGARRDGKTGIWLENRKICAIGVAVKSWVTYHGFALNVKPDLSHFEGIVPCGITDGTVTSMANELDYSIGMSEVKAALAVEFRKVFAKTGDTHD